MARDLALTPAQLQAFLVAHPNWAVTNSGALERVFSFGKFLDGIAFVQQLAMLAESKDHHPDLDIRYTKVTVRLFTHDAKALTHRDATLAVECDRLGKL